MLHPAFLTGGDDHADEAFDISASAIGSCEPRQTDTAAAAASHGKRRRLSAGGTSKVQCPKKSTSGICRTQRQMFLEHMFADMHDLQAAKQRQQAFTKRKRTIMDKAYELSQAADAKVRSLIAGSVAKS